MKTKRAFIVIGAESSGTHALTDLLVAAGCSGHSGKHVNWHIDKSILGQGDDKPWDSEYESDVQPWDSVVPSKDEHIVWRISFPHAQMWPDLQQRKNELRENGYIVHAVVIIRDEYPTIKSQLKWQHVGSFEEGSQNVKEALTRIFEQLKLAEIEYTMTTYEALVNYPQASTRLLDRLGLVLEDTSFSFIDANAKWFENIDSPSVEGFDERAYPCAIENTQAYYQAVSKGRQRMKSCALTVCGLAYNVAEYLPLMIQKIEELGGLFHTYNVVLFENQSRDGTKRLLSEWSGSSNNVTILTGEFNRPEWQSGTDPIRMRYMAECRNQYLQYIRNEGLSSDYVLVLDTDLAGAFSVEGVANTLGHDDWDAVGSNGMMVLPEKGQAAGRVLHYDTWAFRHLGDDDLGGSQAKNDYSFSRGEPMVSVASCFGGMAIYTRAAFDCNATYAGDDCEHVVFHQKLAEQGFGRIKMNPGQIVLYS